MEHFQEIVGQLTPLVSKLSLSQTKPQPNVSKGTTELLAFWEKRRKQYLAKRRRSSSSNMKVSSPPNSLSEPIIDGVTDDDEGNKECLRFSCVSYTYVIIHKICTCLPCSSSTKQLISTFYRKHGNNMHFKVNSVTKLA